MLLAMLEAIEDSELEDYLEALSGHLCEAEHDGLFDLLEKWKTKGKKLTAEHRKKISDALKGRRTSVTKAFKGAAVGAGTGKGALAKRHPVGSKVHTKDGTFSVTGHTSGYIGVSGGKKRWYKLGDLQDQAPKVAAKNTGKVDGSKLFTAKKTVPIAAAGRKWPGAPRKDALHQEAEAAWASSQAVTATYRARAEKDSSLYYNKQFNAMKERDENIAARKYGAALDRRNTAQYEEDLARGITRDKPVTSADILSNVRDFSKLDTSTYNPKDHPDFNAFTKEVEARGTGEWIRIKNPKTGANEIEYFTGKSIGSGLREMGMGDDASPDGSWKPGKDGSPKEWKEATRRRGWLREMYEAREEGMSLREYHAKLDHQAQQAVETALSSGGLFIRATPTTIPKILAGGGFLTQHDTQPDKETTQARARVEGGLFGSKKTGDTHPTYGYLSADPRGRVTKNSALSKGGKKVADTEGEQDWLDGYGGAAIKLKTSAVRSRVTLTHGDTMDIVASNYSSVAVPADKPTGDMFTRRVIGQGNAEYIKNARELRPTRHTGTVDDSMADEVSSWGAKGYVEMQAHDKITPADIEKVIFPKKPASVVTKALKEAGIPWELIPE